MSLHGIHALREDEENARGLGPRASRRLCAVLVTSARPSPGGRHRTEYVARSQMIARDGMSQDAIVLLLPRAGPPAPAVLGPLCARVSHHTRVSVLCPLVSPMRYTQRTPAGARTSCETARKRPIRRTVRRSRFRAAFAWRAPAQLARPEPSGHGGRSQQGRPLAPHEKTACKVSRGRGDARWRSAAVLPPEGASASPKRDVRAPRRESAR